MRHQVLVFSRVFVQAVVLLLKALVDLDVGLAHVVQHRVDTVLQGHLQLARHMVLDQLPEKGVFLSQSM